MNGYVNAYGTIDAAAFGIGMKLSSFATIVSSSCTQAGGTIVAQNIAACKPERVRQQVRQSLLLIIGFAVIAGSLCLLFPEGIFGLFSTDQAVLAYAPTMMKYVVVILFLLAFVSSFGIITTGSGASGIAFCAGIMDGLVFRVTLSFILAYKFNMGMLGFFIGDVFARFGYISVNGIYYFSGKWESRKLVN